MNEKCVWLKSLLKYVSILKHLSLKLFKCDKINRFKPRYRFVRRYPDVEPEPCSEPGPWWGSKCWFQTLLQEKVNKSNFQLVSKIEPTQKMRAWAEVSGKIRLGTFTWQNFVRKNDPIIFLNKESCLGINFETDQIWKWGQDEQVCLEFGSFWILKPKQNK